MGGGALILVGGGRGVRAGAPSRGGGRGGVRGRPFICGGGRGGVGAGATTAQAAPMAPARMSNNPVIMRRCGSGRVVRAMFGMSLLL